MSKNKILSYVKVTVLSLLLLFTSLWTASPVLAQENSDTLDLNHSLSAEPLAQTSGAEADQDGQVDVPEANTSRGEEGGMPNGAPGQAPIEEADAENLDPVNENKFQVMPFSALNNEDNQNNQSRDITSELIINVTEARRVNDGKDETIEDHSTAHSWELYELKYEVEIPEAVQVNPGDYFTLQAPEYLRFTSIAEEMKLENAPVEGIAGRFEKSPDEKIILASLNNFFQDYPRERQAELGLRLSYIFSEVPREQDIRLDWNSDGQPDPGEPIVQVAYEDPWVYDQEKYAKFAWNEEIAGSKYYRWRIRFNNKADEYPGMKLVDTLGLGQTLVPESLVVAEVTPMQTRAEYNNPPKGFYLVDENNQTHRKVNLESDYVLGEMPSENIETHDNGFTIDFAAGSGRWIIDYLTLIDQKNIPEHYSNSVKFIDGETSEQIFDHLAISTNNQYFYAKASGQREPAGEILVQKTVDNEENNLPEGQFVFGLYYKGEPLKDYNGQAITATNDSKGNVKFNLHDAGGRSLLPEGNYVVQVYEHDVQGYQIDKKLPQVEVEVVNENGDLIARARHYNAERPTFNNISLRDVNVRKAWNDGNNQDNKRPDSITVELVANDIKTGQTLELSEANDWKGSFIDLVKKDNDGEIDYTIEEVEVSGYQVAMTGDAATGFTITNTLTQEIPVTKKWRDQNGNTINAPVDEVEAELFRNSETTNQILKLSEDNNWTGIFKDLPVYESATSRKRYEYSVKEVGEINGSIRFGEDLYKVDYRGNMTDGFSITNTPVPPETPPRTPPGNPPGTPPENPPGTPPENPPTTPPGTPPEIPPTTPPGTPPEIPPTIPTGTPPVTPPDGTETPPVTPPSTPPVTPPTTPSQGERLPQTGQNNPLTGLALAILVLSLGLVTAISPSFRLVKN